MGDPKSLDAAKLKAAENDVDYDQLSNQVPFPKHTADIMHESVPDYVRDYWFNVRGFDVDTLRKFGVKIAYLDHPIKSSDTLLTQPVTIIPVYQYGKYWFYQARLIPINGNPTLGYERDMLGSEYPKYYIPYGSKKSWCLYNLDKAKDYEEVAIVEGPTDVWRIGNRAVAKFGRSLSSAQRGILERFFRNKNILLVPDSDDPLAYEEALKDQQILVNSGFFKQVKISKLPEGTDPGDMKGGEEEVWNQLQTFTALPEENLSSLSGLPQIL